MKTSNKRLITILVVWLSVILGLILSEAVEVSRGTVVSSMDGSALSPIRLENLPNVDELQIALRQLFMDDNLDLIAFPTFVDGESAVWVQREDEYFMLTPNNHDNNNHNVETTVRNFAEKDNGNTDTNTVNGKEEYINKIVNSILRSRANTNAKVSSEDDSDCDSCENCGECPSCSQCSDPYVVGRDGPIELRKRDRDILASFLREGWGATDSSWAKDDDSRDICQARGVTCGMVLSVYGIPPVFNVVRHLDLANTNFRATLPPGLAELRDLENLNLAGNNIHGTIPSEYMNMSHRLAYFDIGENNVTGSIPEHFLSTSKDVVEIRLNQNALTGTLVDDFTHWKSLKVLDVADNFIGGTISSQIGQLANLQYFLFANNFISGTLPTELRQLAYLYTVDAGSNFMEGSLEEIVRVLPPRLHDLNLENNFLSGSFSDHVFEQPQLELLMLSYNALTGSLPTGSGHDSIGWSNLSKLRALHLTYNRLSGSLPTWLFTGLKDLTSLTLGNNQLTGTIPSEIGELSSLFIIEAMGNKIQGTLPTTMLNLNRNLRFNFTDNLITGTIPGLFCGEGATSTSMLYQENGCDAVLCRPGTFNIHGHATLHTCCRPCPGLSPPDSLILGRTHCEGVTYVHGDLDGDGKLSAREVLRMLYIDNLGRFWGPTFQRWADMSVSECDLEGVTCVHGRVIKVDLTNANMCSDGNRKPGPTSYCNGLPAEIGELRSLEALQLSRQQFLRGSLPTEIGKLTNLRLLDVSSCVWMTGRIPTEVGLLTNLKVLKIVHTHVRGTIPSELFSLSGLEILHLTNNKLTGTLPPTKMDSMKELMISRNMLSGSFPSSLGDMKKLENLEAYHNEFTGQLPSELGGCSFLKRIDVFSCKLTGTIPSSYLNLESLQILHLKGNKLTGTVPELGRLTRMSWLDLSNNAFHGTIPHSLGSSLVIEDLRLGGNMLYDPIPRGLCANPNVNGGATKQYGCDGILCPLGTFAETSGGHASESHGPCTPCPSSETTLYLGSPRNACQEIRPEEILTMFYDVMQGELWPSRAQHNWGDLTVSICEWAGISCDANGELTGMAFPLVGVDDY